MSRDAWGIDTVYRDAMENEHTVSRKSIEAIRSAIGHPPKEPRSLFEEPVKVVRRGESLAVPGPAELRLEDGTAMEVRHRLPNDMPIGYHELAPKGDSASTKLIVTPGCCHLPSGLRTWGLSAQVYAARSRSSWGIGDLADLRRLGEWAKSIGAGMVLINPLNATLPILPQEASPYSPSSRRYRNPLYLHIEDIPGVRRIEADLRRLAADARALNDERRIDRDRVFQLKLDVLQKLWVHFREDADFDRFQRDQGPSLDQFAVFNVLAEEHGADWRRWPSGYRRSDGGDMQRFTQERADRVRFHKWLQWLLDRQLARAAEPAALMQDLPVGFSPNGADAWAWQDLVALDCSIGAPPDLFNKVGQNWGLPPFIPHRLRQAAYEPFIQTIRAAMRHTGGLRIDHVMGLFRLWWVPHGCAPKDGAYVRYRADDLLGIIALESRRAGAVVVGEDLGTVEEGVREQMAACDMLSYRLLWFEDTTPSDYPEKALAAVTTHDLPTLAGIWTGADLDLQRRSGLDPDKAAAEKLRQKMAQINGIDQRTDLETAAVRTFEQLAVAPSVIVMATMEAACLASERPNMPGAEGTYPNWSLALPLSLEEIETAQFPHRLGKVLSRRNRAHVR
ncbi:MAG: 4-alpha-glucanotransferase (amylomaltase) [Nitrospira sp.]|jgi:4-alpha-glucanotransferase|nr:4-alpha-glucanotransferase (amylomaltase) [Nitrospira sp.]